MRIRRYEPWSIFDLMQRELQSFSARRPALEDHDTTVADWVPAVDIVEEKGRFVLKADVPGVEPGEIEVSTVGGVLSVSGERHTESRSESDGRQRVERISGRFHRRFTLPESADTDGIEARSSQGILEITIPKQPEVQARRISVKAA